jgi:hypothetical protein
MNGSQGQKKWLTATQCLFVMYLYEFIYRLGMMLAFDYDSLFSYASLISFRDILNIGQLASDEIGYQA